MTSAAPAPIQRFIDATNAGDTEAFLESFTQGGFLSDWGRTFTGRTEIARWNQSDNIGVQSRLQIVAIEQRSGTWHARIVVSGNGFNGEGSMAFTIEGERIAQLVIS